MSSNVVALRQSPGGTHLKEIADSNTRGHVVVWADETGSVQWSAALPPKVNSYEWAGALSSAKHALHDLANGNGQDWEEE